MARLAMARLALAMARLAEAIDFDEAWNPKQ